MSTGLVTMAGGKRAADQDFVDLTIDSDDEAPLVSPAAKKGAAAPAIVARLGLKLVHEWQALFGVPPTHGQEPQIQQQT
jgi:hypothetical protein